MNRGTGGTSKRSLFPRYAIHPLVLCLDLFVPNCHESLFFAPDHENPRPLPQAGEGEGIFLRRWSVFGRIQKRLRSRKSIIDLSLHLI